MDHYLKLSAKNQRHLMRLVEQCTLQITQLGANQSQVLQFCRALNDAKEDFKHRLVVRFDNHATLLAGLSDYLNEKYNINLHYGVAKGNEKVCFVFSGQGAQTQQMGMQLYKENDLFRTAILRCAAIADPLLDVPLLSVLFDSNGLINDTEYAQPCLFAVQYAYGQLLQHKLGKPAMVMGHSLGEYSALHFAGVLSLEQVIPLICKRAQLMSHVSEKGIMLSARAPIDVLKGYLSHFPQVEIAAINSPNSLVYSGSIDDIEALQLLLEQADIRVKRLHTSNAFHSRFMQPASAELKLAADGVVFNKPTIPVIDNVSARYITEAGHFNPNYLVQQLVSTVNFADGCRLAHLQGVNTFIEVGPSAVYGLLAECAEVNTSASYIATCSKQGRETRNLFNAIAQYYCEVGNLTKYAQASLKSLHKANLPAYPFEESRFAAPNLQSELSLSLPVETDAPIVAETSNTVLANANSALPVLDIIKALSMNEQVSEDLSITQDLGFDSILVSRLAAELQHFVELPSAQILNLIYESDSITSLIEKLQDSKANKALTLPTQWQIQVHHKDVHKDDGENLLLEQLSQLDECNYILSIAKRTSHSFFYEHPKDHVPGLYLIEAARQAPVAICHHFLGIDFSKPFILNDLQVQFSNFAETHADLHMQVFIEPRTATEQNKVSYYCEIQIYQGELPIGQFKSRFVVFKKAHYQSLRDQQQENIHAA